MKINWVNFVANIIYLMFAVFVVHLLAHLVNQDADAIVGWAALGMAASAHMAKVFE